MEVVIAQADSRAPSMQPAPLSWIVGHRRRFEPTMLLWLALVGVLLFLVVGPVLRLFISSFEATDGGQFTLANYAIAYGTVRSWEALLNSILYGVAVTLVAIVLAVPVAWAISRTDMPCKGLVRAVILGAFITPPISAQSDGSFSPGPMLDGSTTPG
jgi:iron(III) transport system permease protein